MEKLFQRYDLQLVEADNTKYKSEQIKSTVVNSCAVANKIMEVFKLDKKAEEHCVLLCLDSRNYINGAFYISIGDTDSSTLCYSSIFKRALLCNSKKIIIAHNHPTGISKPSTEDYKVTEQLEKVAKLIGIELLDHLVIGKNEYTSIMKERMD